MPSDLEILAENRVGDALNWLRVYAGKHPDWIPSLQQLNKLSDKFKLSEGKILELYERVSTEKKVEGKVREIIDLSKEPLLF